ncbi:MAG TPA: hypothetical protein VF751_07795 [Chthoniobacterales bacterium]
MARLKKASWVALSLIFASIACAAPTPAEALREADAICRRDNGALWGVSLCGPMLLVDPKTRAVFANEPGPENQLKRDGDVFVGTLPEKINIANSAVDWAGTKWTMIMLPLPEEKDRRTALMAHEMWHRIQSEIGLPASAAAANNHLDTRDGRFWLQLEWRALAAALQARGAARTEAVKDAALFRARRRELFPEAANAERDLELNEGLAEYTGAKLSGSPDLAGFVVGDELKEAPTKKTFVRSFAYATGPAYGLLLDDTGGGWRQVVRSRRDLAELLLERTGTTLPEKIEAAANECAPKYGSAELAANEDRREQNRRDLVKSYRARLIDGPTLLIPLQKMNMQFDPGNLVPLDSLGTVYPNIRIVDNWGILTVSKGGALLSADFSRVTVPAPAKIVPPLIEGDGWTLRLNSGWSLRSGERHGDFTLLFER